MMKNFFIAGFILIQTLAISVHCQDNASSQKTLKEAFAGKFLIGCADDLTSNNDAYQASIKAQYDIVTPENCMIQLPLKK